MQNETFWNTDRVRWTHLAVLLITCLRSETFELFERIGSIKRRDFVGKNI